MPEGIHLVNVFVSPVVCRPFKVLAGECRWEYMVKRVRLPFLVHFQRWIGEALVNDCRQRGACGECRRNYMALWAPVRLRAAAKNRSGLTGGQR